jgi:hypothetical protein
MKFARLAGVALDARAAAYSDDPVERALAARWIAGNLLAVRGRLIAIDGRIPDHACLFGLRVAKLIDLVAAIAAVPALVDASTLPASWRLTLRVLGLPVLDRPASLALGGGASVAELGPQHPSYTLTVDAHATGYRVHVAPCERMLVA